MIVYQPCVTFTDEDHRELLDWVRDENNSIDNPPPISGTQTRRLYWEVAGKLFVCPGSAVYSAGGNPDKVRRCYLIIEDNFKDLYHPPNWLDRKRTHA